MSNFRQNQNPPPLSLITRSCMILNKRGASKGAVLHKVARKTSGPGASKPKLRQAVDILKPKPYIPSLTPMVAPMPFFNAGRLNTVMDSFSPQEELAVQCADSPVAGNMEDEDTLVGMSMMLGDAVYNDDSESVIVETAEKAIQTDCKCECRCGNQKPSSSLKLDSTHQLTREVAKLSHIVRGVASKITGKQTIDMSKYFPINKLADLQALDIHIDKTENFLLQLDMYLKDLIPANSTAISFGLRQLVTDSFLYGKNWDGRDAESLKQYRLFNSILFESWKSGVLTKMVYVKTMRKEIKKAHDRHYRYLQSKKQTVNAEVE